MAEKNPSQSDPIKLILPPKNERFWAMTAHFSQLLFYLLAFLALSLDNKLSLIIEIVSLLIGPIICFIIYLVYKNRSPFTSFQSLQALIFQPILFIIIGFISVIFKDTLDGPEALIPSMCMLPFLGIWPFFGFIGGIQSIQGKDFEYPIIGKRLKNNKF